MFFVASGAKNWYYLNAENMRAVLRAANATKK